MPDPRPIDAGMWNQNQSGQLTRPDGSPTVDLPDWWLENLYRAGYRPEGEYPARGGERGEAWNPYADFEHNMNPNFQYWEPNTTQSDINASNQLGQYEDIFMEEADRYGGFEEQLFDAWMRNQEQMDTGGTLDEAIRGGIHAGNIGAEQWFQGTAGDPDTYQGHVQGALASVGQNAFGTSSGAVSNALVQGADIGSRRFQRGMEATFPQLFQSMTQRDIAQMQNIGAHFAGYGGLRSNAIESAYGAGASAAELPFLRSGERQNRAQQQQEMDFFEEAAPDLLKSIKNTTPGKWYEEAAKGVGRGVIGEAGEWVWEEGLGWGFRKLGSAISNAFGGGDGGGRNDGGGYGGSGGTSGAPPGYPGGYTDYSGYNTGNTSGDTGYAPPGYGGYGGYGGGYEQPGGYVDYWAERRR